jgi:MFS family permease
MADQQPNVERKNFILNFVEGAIFSASGALMSPQTVLPVLVSQLGGSNVAVGSLSVIVWVGLFLPQVFAARYVQTLPWKKPWAIKFGMAQRVAVLFIAVSLLIFGGVHQPIALASFFIFYSLCQVLMGITTPGWFDMFAKMIPTRKRGRLVGIRSSLGGIGAFCCGLLLTWLLTRFSFPLNFALAFFIAFLMQAVSVIVQSNLIELEPSPVTARRPLFAYLRELPDVLKSNRAFRNFLIATVIQILATMPVGFYTVYAMSAFQLEPLAVGEFTLAIVAVQVVSSLIIGYLADKHGNKLSLVVAAVALLCANTLALLAPTQGWFFLVYIFLGINLGTELLARYNISVEYGPPELRSTYIGLMNTIIAPFYLVGIIGGKISDLYGYPATFWCGTVLSIIGVFVVIFQVQEPRSISLSVGK